MAAAAAVAAAATGAAALCAVVILYLRFIASSFARAATATDSTAAVLAEAAVAGLMAIGLGDLATDRGDLATGAAAADGAAPADGDLRGTGALDERCRGEGATVIGAVVGADGSTVIGAVVGAPAFGAGEGAAWSKAAPSCIGSSGMEGNGAAKGAAGGGAAGGGAAGGGTMRSAVLGASATRWSIHVATPPPSAPLGIAALSAAAPRPSASTRSICGQKRGRRGEHCACMPRGGVYEHAQHLFGSFH